MDAAVQPLPLIVIVITTETIKSLRGRQSNAHLVYQELSNKQELKVSQAMANKLQGMIL